MSPTEESPWLRAIGAEVKMLCAALYFALVDAKKMLKFRSTDVVPEKIRNTYKAFFFSAAGEVTKVFNDGGQKRAS